MFSVIKVGELSYIAWGTLHIWVSWTMWQLSSTQMPGIAQARLQQGALFMLFFALAGIAIAATWLWRGRLIGYWTNLLLISYADIIWILLFIVPGLVGGVRGWAGPVLWITAALLTTWGFFAGGPANQRRTRTT